MFFRILLFLAILCAFSNVANADSPKPQLVVSSGADSGPGTLRAVLLEANKRPGARISFQIPRTDPAFDTAQGRFILLISSPLPAIKSRHMRIEGESEIELSGQQLPANAPILQVQARDCHIAGVRFRGFNNAISLQKGGRYCDIERCEFLDGAVGVQISERGAHGSMIRINLFDEVRTPIGQSGTRKTVDAPQLHIERRDHQNSISHVLKADFKGKPDRLVTLDIGYSPDEARDKPQVRAWKFSKQIRTDQTGHANWIFELPGYPAGSWSAFVTTEEGTSELSDTIVMPYLR